MADVMVPWINGHALIIQGDHAEGYSEPTRSIKVWCSSGGLHEVAFCDLHLGTALTALNRFDEARAVLDEALDLIEQRGNRKDQAEVHRVLGELL